jgi:hypothetical protein
MSDLQSPEFVSEETKTAAEAAKTETAPQAKMFAYDGFVFALPIDPVTNAVTKNRLLTFLLAAIAAPNTHDFLKAAMMAVVDAQGKQFFPRTEEPKA